MAYAEDKQPLQLTELTSLATGDGFVVGDADDATEVAKYITKANLITDLTTTFQVNPSEGAFANGDKTKLDGIEASADVTDTANVTTAGALMDSECVSLVDVKALNQSVVSGASPVFATTNMTAGTNKNFVTDAEATVIGNTSGTNTGDEVASSATVAGVVELATIAEVDTGTDTVRAITPAGLAGSALQTKVNGIETGADVTDTANVTSAGALMDSECTSLADVKALNQSVVSGASPTFTTTNMTDATNKRFMSDAQETVLDNTSGTNTGDEASASTTVAGVAELATIAEVNTGTDTGRTVTPDALAGSNLGIRYVGVVCFDYTTATATGDGKGYFHIPAGLNGMNLVEVHAEVITAGTTGTTDIQIHNLTQTADMLSTKITIDSAETGSDTGATPAVIDTANDDVATNDLIRIDVDAVSTTPANGLIVTLGFQLP